MEVRMTAEMVEALKATPEIPDDLAARVAEATPDGDDFVVTLSDDESMAMIEMCEWYVRKDPDTGELTERGKIFDRVVQTLYDADTA